MDNNLISNQIAKFRKAAGLTQEELGRAVGVSTQAVSRWECGGAPDVTLLPAIADKLGVAIDALFGREGGKSQSLSEFLEAQVITIPEARRYQALSDGIWRGLVASLGSDCERYEISKSCYPLDRFPDIMCSSRFETDQGYCTGIASQEFSFLALCPEPEGGYARFLPDKEKLRMLFALLSRPGCLEIVEYMLQKPISSGFFTPEVLAKGAGIPPEEASALLEQLAQTGLAQSIQVQLVEGSKAVYCLREFSGSYYLTLCYTARWLTQTSAVHMVGVDMREKPWLKSKKGEST